jgi:hypothetical protein
MITSKQITAVLEIYSKSRAVSGEHKVDIYENPTSSDITSIFKTAREENRKVGEIRFIADAKSKKVYIADSYYIIHYHMYNTLNLMGDFGTYLNYPNLFDGIAVLYNGKITMNGWDRFSLQIPRINIPETRNWFDKLFSYDWSFADRYINGCSKFIDYKKKQFEFKVQKQK